ncbi:stage II sporulation protein M [Thermodesulfobacteriota bacterium]
MLIKPKFIDKYLFRLLGPITGFRHFQNRSLIVLTLWLHLTPLFAVALLGIELGAVTAAAQILWGSFLLFAATIIPHGLLELPAICLAAALPFGTYRFVRDTAQKGAVEDVFRDVRVVIRSQQTRRKLGYITCLLLAAGIVESRLTPFVAEWVATMIR